MKKMIIILIAVIFIGTNILSAGSLWNKNQNRSVYSDRKAIKRGDIITIIVIESTSATTDNENKKDKQVSIGGKTGASASSDKTIFNSMAKLIPLFGAEAKGGSSLQSKGAVSKSNSLQTRLAVTVEDIDANGNLKLKGEKNLLINKEKQKILFHGICRLDDVTVDNTILSSQVANAQIEYDGKQVLSKDKHKGWFTKAAESVWNFLF